MSKRVLFVLILALLSPLIAVAAEQKILSLHLEGAPRQKLIWLVEVRQGDSDAKRFSRIYARSEGEPLWQLRTIIPAEVTQVTRYGGEVVTLLPTGDWMIVGQSSGRALPDGAKVISLAGDDQSLYAVGEFGGATTQPSTAPADSEKAGAATRPAGRALFRLQRGDWRELAALPEGAGAKLALGVLEGAPTLATLDGNELRLWRFAGDDGWHELGRTEVKGDRPAEILEEGGRSFVYVAGQPSELLVRDAEFSEAIALSSDSAVQTLGLAGGQLRFLYAEGETIKERLLNPRDLQFQGADSELVLPSPVDVEEVRTWVHWVMMALITLVMIHTYRKRDEYRQVKLDWTKVQLAPFGRRFFAGMIDLVPVIAALLYTRVSVPAVETPPDVLQSMAASRLMLLGIGVFLAHTTIIEALTGRSIGKMITHIRVVRLDGNRPTVVSLLIRNLLRVVDLVLWFTLILMLYLPLRQRLGDLAAGTIVVVDREEQH